jgi:hypothetical protein
MATTNYNINYDDERFQDVEADKQEALEGVNSTYDEMINQSDKYYQDQIDATKEWEAKQQELQQQNTDHLIGTIEQQKAQAEKDYTKEQKGAYVDWQKQSNQYGANAEQMASQGLTNTGYSESSQTSMYNQYQGRVATARETFARAVLNYDNSIKEAQLTNNSKLAEIAYQSLQTQLQLSLEGFQYKNQLLQAQIEQQQLTEDRYYSRWQDVLAQMNQENQFAESIRQYEKNYELQTKQLDEQIRQYEQNYALQVKEFDEGIRQFEEQMKYYREKDAEEYKYKLQQLELQKQELEQRKLEAERSYNLQVQQLEEQKRQYNKTYNATYNSNNKYTDTSGGGTDNHGNNSTTMNKSDYYFSNGYQPRYVNNTKLAKSKLQVKDVFIGAGKLANQNIWQANGKYYVWDGVVKEYVDVTSKVTSSLERKVNYPWGR